MSLWVLSVCFEDNNWVLNWQISLALRTGLVFNSAGGNTTIACPHPPLLSSLYTARAGNLQSVSLDLATAFTSRCSIYCSLWSICIHKTLHQRFQSEYLQHILQISSLSRLLLMRVFCNYDVPRNGPAVMSLSSPIGPARRARLHIFQICVPTCFMVAEIGLQPGSHLSRRCWLQVHGCIVAWVLSRWLATRACVLSSITTSSPTFHCLTTLVRGTTDRDPLLMSLDNLTVHYD